MLDGKLPPSSAFCAQVKQGEELAATPAGDVIASK